MKILNYGSLNIDKVYGVERFVRAGETISATSLELFGGGKGLNQSVALARAGAPVYHFGAVGPDGDLLREVLCEAGVQDKYLFTVEETSGHAIIQLMPKGQNCIIVYGGANHSVTPAQIDSVLQDFSAGDLLLLQNETANVGIAMQKAHAKGMKIALNPSPISEDLLRCPLESVDWFILNEVEGQALAGMQSQDYVEVLHALAQRFPRAATLLTVGKQGAYYKDANQQLHHGVYNVPVSDTTAAGDTFCGYFLASLAKEISPVKALHYASCASSLAVSCKGASPSIPTWKQVLAFSQKNGTIK